MKPASISARKLRARWEEAMENYSWLGGGLNRWMVEPAGSRRPSNRRGAPRYTIARCNWESSLSHPGPTSIHQTRVHLVQCLAALRTDGYGWFMISVHDLLQDMSVDPTRFTVADMSVDPTQFTVSQLLVGYVSGARMQNCHSRQPSGRPTTYNASHYSHQGW